MYGDYDLQRGDRDGNPSSGVLPIWGGVTDPGPTANPEEAPPVPVNPGELNTVTIPEHVRRLQEDLRTLGFACIDAPTGYFGRQTFWAVREFQIYASLATVARVRASAPADQHQGAHVVSTLGQGANTLSVYVGSLEAVTNDGAGRYTGPISGVVNQATRDALSHWLENEYRCPVIIEAWRVAQGNRTTLVASNLWRHDHTTSTAPRMFARDFTGKYTLPGGRNPDDMYVIGDFVTYMTWSGPRSLPPNHTFSEGELLPEALTGTATLAGAELSTYRVVRSVSEVECLGFFDSVNCYDNAFVSVGPCHWTLGIVDAQGAFSEGELCGYLAYLRHADNAAFQDAFECFGVRVDEDWGTDGSALFSAAQRKYTGWVAFQQENGTYARCLETEAEGNYFKTWHWHYRFVMAGRCVEGYRRRMWHMGRVRVRDILNVPWGTGVAQVAGVGGAPARAATIGDVFTSERAVAYLLRWHIRYPGHVVSGGGPGQRLRNALTDAQTAAPNLNWTTDPSTWTNAHETALLNAISANPPSGVQEAFNYIRDWPNWLAAGSNPRRYALAAPTAAALATTRSSFALDDAGLPPAPP